MKSKQQTYEDYLRYLQEPDYLTTAEVSRRSGAPESSVRRWRRGQNIPSEPQVLIETKRTYNTTRKTLRRLARELPDNIERFPDRCEHTFLEIAEILELRESQVRIIYLNATRKIKIILERKGVDIGLIPERLEELDHQF